MDMKKVNLSIKLKNRLNELDKIRAAVSKMSATTACTQRSSKEINLILEEIFTNVVNYGFDDDKEHVLINKIRQRTFIADTHYLNGIMPGILG